MNIEKWMDLAADKCINLLDAWKDTEKHPEWFKDQQEHTQALKELREEVDFLDFAAQNIKAQNSPIFHPKPKLIYPIKQEFIAQYQYN